MSELKKIFENNTRNAIHKWIHYFDVYDFWFKKYKAKPVVILEIGVYQGGSLNMWRQYFGAAAKIYAIDINPACKQFETENTRIFIGSQEDREFLKSVKQKIPKVDILIDDGGHTMNQQITTFEELYGHVNYDGIYLCEDLHTSYWRSYGGGYKKRESFIEYSKNFIDSINAWHSEEEEELSVNEFTRSTYSIHYYDSVLVVQKGIIEPPKAEFKGEFIIPVEDFPAPSKTGNTNRGNFKIIKFFQKKIQKTFQISKKMYRILNSKKGEPKEKEVPRFTPTEKFFLGKKIYIHDIASFSLGYLELFKNETYKFCAKSEDPLIIDCGANIGMSIIYFKELYPSASIIAFEADGYIFTFLEKNISSFEYSNIKLINKAVWNCETTLSFLAEGGAGGRIETEREEGKYKRVPTVRLKEFLVGQEVEFLKLDIEGAEYAVIEDCKEELKNVAHLFIEYHSFPDKQQKLQEILKIVQEAGFRYHIKEAYTTKEPFLERKLNVGMDLQLNIFCFRERATGF